MSPPRQDPWLERAAVQEAARRRGAVLAAEDQVSLDGTNLVTGKAITFRAQRGFIEDRARRVAACCSRRAGKSDAVAIKLITAGVKNPGKRIPYTTLSRPMGKNIMWGKLRFWAAAFGVRCHLNSQLLECTLPNGACVFIASAENYEEIEKLRGGDYPLVALDEVQAFKPGVLKLLLEEILPYALFDHDGQLVLTGTPSAACAGYFYEVTTGKVPGWAIHHWTMFDNPYIPAKKRADEYLRERKLTGREPKVRREMFGEWVRDSEHSVFGVEEHHLLDELPNAPDWRYVVSADYGYKDATAFVVQAYSVARGIVVAVEAFERTKLLTGPASDIAKELWDRYEPTDLVGDTGGLGKPYAEEVIQRHGLPMESAEKKDKLSAIEWLNGDLQEHRVFMLRSLRDSLWLCARELEWDFDKVFRKRGVDGSDSHIARADLAISDRTPDHLTDAWLYGYRKCRAYLHREDAPNVDDPNALQPWEVDMLDRWERDPVEAEPLDEGAPIEDTGLSAAELERLILDRS